MVAVYSPWMETYTDHTLIITANRRLATQLRVKYDQTQRHAGRQSWPSLHALPLATFMEQCYRQLLDKGYTDKLLLNEQHVLLLFEQIIQSDPIPLLRPFATAEKVQQAWQLCQLWRLDFNKALFCQQQDTERFWHWAMEFKHQCMEKNWCDLSAAANIILNGIMDKALTVEKDIMLVGFDEVPPLHREIFNQLQQTGCQVDEEALPAPSKNSVRSPFADNEAEIAGMIRWAKEKHDHDLKARIACVIPNLQSLRSDIERQFQTLFKSPRIQSKVNISGGRFLSDFQLINTAIFILELVDNKSIDVAKFSALLRSPYFSHPQQELSPRHVFDNQLRRQGKIQFNLAQIAYYLRETSLPLDNLANTLQHVIDYAKTQPKKLSPAKWAEQFTQLLQMANWPGDRHINSLEYQLIGRWQSLLQDFSQLGWVEPHMNYKRSLTLLKRLCQSTLFQIKTDNAPIQVLGMLEAAGNEFDYLWVMGLHAGLWPAIAKPNPFIPRHLQTKHQIPHANAQRELLFSQQMMQRFATMAHEIIYSYPLRKNDETLIMSPLLEPYAALNLQAKTLEKPSTAPIELEFIEDLYGPTLESGSHLTGGARSFQLQAACPFRAFAEMRLHSEEIDDPHLGLDAWQRGTTLHAILQSAWETLKDQATLLDYDPKQLEVLITQITQDTLEKMNHKNIKYQQPRFMALEKQRLVKLIMDWLDIEKQRTPFKVLFEEYEINSSIEGLEFSIKMDRVDQLEMGETLIIDYKTGKVTPHGWFDERIDDPQMPLYALSYHNPIDGILFAQIHTSGLQFKGVCDVDEAIPNAKPFEKFSALTEAQNWQEQLQLWEGSLQNMAKEIAQGYAGIAPKYGEISCQYCQLMGLCRINEAGSPND